MERNPVETSKRSSWFDYAVRTGIYEPISPAPLALFRVAFGVILLMEVLQFINRSDLVFTEHPGRDDVPNSVQYVLVLWAGSLVCVIMGILTRIATCISYACTFYFFKPDSVFEYHADMLYLPGGLLVALLPVHRTWSVDAFLSKRLWGVDHSARPVPRLYNNSIVYLLLAVVYFDSIFFKLTSEFWRGGLGVWLPASVPSCTTFSWNVLLNQEWLIKVAGYLTVIFEVVFLFLFWIPAARIYLLIIGIALHAGIALVFPIPLFGILALSVYVLLFPDPAMSRMSSWWTGGQGNNPHSDATGLLSKPDIGFLMRDIVLVRLMMPLLGFLTLAQLSLIAHIGIFTRDTYYWLNRTVAIQRHEVFGDVHFGATKRELALAYYNKAGLEEWLPWVGKDGFSGSESYGRFWVFWLRTAAPGPGSQHLWCARAAESWARKSGRSLEEGYVLAKARRPELKVKWERDRLLKNRDLPWTDIMKITWVDGQRHFARIEPKRVDRARNQ